MDLSFWERDTYFSNIDILIIGSGIVGLSAALEVKQQNPNLKVLIIERGFLPSGASSKNAGFSCFGSVSELLDDLTHTSEDIVFSLVEKRWRGLQQLRKNLGDDSLELNNWGGFEVFNDEGFYNQCIDKLPYLNKMVSSIIGDSSVYVNADSKINSFGLGGVSHLIENRFEGQINSGKMISTLIKKVQSLGVYILNSLEVTSIAGANNSVDIVLQNGIEFKAGKVLVATNGFAKQLLPQLNVQPARAQVLITEPIKDLKIKGTFHYDKGYYYFRNVGDRVLFGGGRNLDFKGEETTEMITTELIQKQLDNILQNVILPGVPYKVSQRWSGIMGVGEQKTTIVKPLGGNIYCSVRMGGMGVAIGSLIGQEAATMLLD
jgi:glycine/D-amino acid oxidase-like deaminating enzyme